MEPIVIVGVAIVVLFLFSGIRIVRPTNRALVERLGKYPPFCFIRVQLDYSGNRSDVHHQHHGKDDQCRTAGDHHQR